MAQPSHVSVVVTDPRAAARCVRVSRPGTAVVLVAPPGTALPPKLARRVRVVAVRRAADVAARALEQLAGDGVVLLAGPDTHLSPGWEEGASAAAAALGGAVGQLGSILLAPAGADASASRVPLLAVDGVNAPLVPGPRPSPSSQQAPAPSLRLSAVLIVKDEERVLGECLAALAGAVDEVVVYDTGSTDGTREVAREHGAVVVEGFWDGHFGNARNRALEHATGDWVVSVDADEVLTGDAGVLRRVCAAAPQGLARLLIVSMTWSGALDGQRSNPVRLFRREDFTWVGALHEYLAPLPGVPVVTEAPGAQGVHLLHSGYEYTTFSDRDKTSRNLVIAEAAVAALPSSGEEPTAVWDAYGRSLLVAGRHGEALEALDRVLEHQGNSSTVVIAGRAALAAMHEVGDTSRADRWFEALERHGEAPAAVAAGRARVALAIGDVAGALQHLEHARRAAVTDRWGLAVHTSVLEALRAEVLVQSGRPVEALDVLLASLEADPDDLPLGTLVLVATAAGTDLGDLAARVPAAFTARSAQEAVLLPQPLGHLWLRGLVAARPDDLGAVVAGSVVGSRSDLETAVHWSSAVRAAGLPHLCPLRAVAGDPQRSAAERVLAWSLVAGVAQDDDARAELALLLAALEPHALLEAVGPAAELVPAVGDVLLSAVQASVVRLEGAPA